MHALEPCVRRILKASRLRPRIGIVLGSGFQTVTRGLEIDRELGYAKLPGFPKLTVPGHEPRLIIGRLEQVPVYLFCGRAHYYEGHSMDSVTFPIRVLAGCGVQSVLLTNAAGGINPKYRPGHFMALTDHINFMGINPLRTTPESGAPAFVDLTTVYDVGLRRTLEQAGEEAGVRMHSGVYISVPGPSYETPAEIRAFAQWGADAVGMSTVPEAIVARSCGLAVAGLSSITNRAAGLGRAPLSHAEVLAAAASMKEKLSELLGRFVQLAFAADR